MKKYRIPITWQSIHYFDVWADNLQGAVERSLRYFIDRPTPGYIEDSLGVDEIIRDNYPGEDYDIDKAINNI